MLYLTALILGLSGSLHCVGMCGAIALALPGKSPNLWTILPGRLAYNAGRVAAYVMMGAVLGLFGQVISLAGWQQALSLVLGGLMLILALGQFQAETHLVRIPLIDKVLVRIRKAMGHLLRPGSKGLFQVGVLNGFLPCGTVYLALAGAAATSQALEGMGYMAVFGLGTFATMLPVSLAGGRITGDWMRVARPVMAGVTLVFASWLILRGLQLGIPFISPLLPAGTQAEQVVCH
ncbi:MAG: sulfite exporter TauE/SafE family protein [Bacteroidia bacterium]|nr:sulfite exporter TauE/SafE family protein [Bacteroidia bacterium]